MEGKDRKRSDPVGGKMKDKDTKTNKMYELFSP